MEPEQILAKLAARSHAEGDCLIWEGPPITGGYGQVRVGDKIMRVHRAAWIARNGPIPPETPEVLHACDNPMCWAEAHLSVGTNAENMADRSKRKRHGRWNATKTHCVRGHEYNEANTRHVQGKRYCRVCARERARRCNTLQPKK